MAEILSLPDIPISPMFIGDDRTMTVEWQEFFRILVGRVGGVTAPTINESNLSTVSELYSTPKDNNKKIDDLEKEIESLSISKFYNKDIAELKKLINIYSEVREPFKFYLPQIVWDDLRFPVGSIKGGGAFDTTPTAYKGGIVEAFSTGPNNESVQFIGQFPHSRKSGSYIEFHLHWVIPTSGAGGGAENVKWDFTYSWADINGSFPAESSATITVDVQNINADTHIYTDIVDIDGSGKIGVSSMIICSLTRDVGVANDYADNAYFLEADFHFQADSIGSRLEHYK